MLPFQVSGLFGCLSSHIAIGEGCEALELL